MALNACLVTDARRILRAAERTCTRVVSVDSDSILFLDDLGRTRTAWLHRNASGKVSTSVCDGFDADPPVGLHPEPDPEPVTNTPHMQPKPRF